MNIPLKNTQITERERIFSYLLDFYIVDVGYIKSIEDDKKFVEVVHATKTQLYDEASNTFKEQEETVTKHIEVLYFGGANFRIEHELKTSDVGLLLGTMTYVEKMRDLTEAKKSEHISNYQQENLKFLPIGNNETPKTLLQFFDDEIKLDTDIKNTTIDLKTTFEITTDADFEGTFNESSIKIKSTGINLTDKNNNIWETTSTGTKLTDLSGNIIETKASEIDINGSEHNAIFGDTLVTAFTTWCNIWSSMPTGTEAQNAAVLSAMQGGCAALLSSLNSAKSNKVKLG